MIFCWNIAKKTGNELPHDSRTENFGELLQTILLRLGPIWPSRLILETEEELIGLRSSTQKSPCFLRRGERLHRGGNQMAEGKFSVMSGVEPRICIHGRCKVIPEIIAASGTADK